MRPWATHVDLENCPHCGVEVAEGHYVCWNCSQDIREPTEAEVYSEYEEMVAKTELANERRNRNTFIGIIVASLLLAAITAWVWWDPYWGLPVLFLIVAALAGRGLTKSMRRIGRIRKTHGL